MMPTKTKRHRNREKGLGRATANDPTQGSQTVHSGHAAKQESYLEQAEFGQLLLSQGQADRASAVFEAMLSNLASEPSYGRAVVMERLGRCSIIKGQSAQALSTLRDALAITA